MCVDGAGAGASGFQEVMAAESGDFTPVDTLADDPAMMIYTSGTTGPPKGALHAHRVLPGHLPGFELVHEFFPRRDDLMWTPADWAWAGGLLNAMLPSLHFGVTVVARKFEKFDPEEAYAACWPTCGSGTPSCRRRRCACCAPFHNPRGRFDLELRTIGHRRGEALRRGDPCVGSRGARA